MNDPQNRDRKDDVLLGDLFRPLVSRGRHIRRGTVLGTVIAGLLGGIYFFIQPTTRSASLGFRPTFTGADAGRYPNALAFSPTDIIDPSVLSQVYEANELEQYCPPDDFNSGFVVEESSPELQFLNLEYQARLSDTRLTAVDRQTLQNEYANRRGAIQSQYELIFFQLGDCTNMPRSLMFKAVPEVLQTWATDAEAKRGVMRFQVPILTPRLFEHPGDEGESLLVRADLLRTAVVRVIANIEAVERLPGSGLVRGSERQVSLSEVRATLEDLTQARLDPLIAVAGRGLGVESRRFLQQAIQSSEIRLRAAQQRAETYRQALRDYSGVPTAPQRPASGDRQVPSDVQALTPQIDRTFIEGIVELSATNTAFRQEITRQAIEAAIEAVERGAVVEQYRQLLLALADSGGDQLSVEAVTKALDRVATEAKEATRDFNAIYAEFIRVSLRAGAAMYRIERPMESVTVRAFGLRDYAFVLVAVFIATPILLAIAFLIQFYIRKFVNSVP